LDNEHILSGKVISAGKELIGLINDDIVTWSIEDRAEIQRIPCQKPLSITLSPDETFAYVGCYDGMIYTVDLQDGELIPFYNPGSENPLPIVYEVALSRDGRWLVSCHKIDNPNINYSNQAWIKIWRVKGEALEWRPPSQFPEDKHAF
jgi:WD40 repeat protein